MGFVVRAVMAASPARAAVRAANTSTYVQGTRGADLISVRDRQQPYTKQLEAMYDEVSLEQKQVCLSHASSMLLSRHQTLTGMVGGLEEPQ
jgi:hypothetical protein